MQLLDINEELIRETRRRVRRGDYDAYTFNRRYRSLVFEVLDYVATNGPPFRLERRPEPEAGVSRLQRPSEVINTICDLADSDMDMVERAKQMEPAVHMRVHGLIEKLYDWQVLHP
jgi:hypothetical protein